MTCSLAITQQEIYCHTTAREGTASEITRNNRVFVLFFLKQKELGFEPKSHGLSKQAGPAETQISRLQKFLSISPPVMSF